MKLCVYTVIPMTIGTVFLFSFFCKIAKRSLEISFPLLLLHAAVLVEVDDAGGAFRDFGGHHLFHDFFYGVGFGLDGAGERVTT